MLLESLSKKLLDDLSKEVEGGTSVCCYKAAIEILQTYFLKTIAVC